MAAQYSALSDNLRALVDKRYVNFDQFKKGKEDKLESEIVTQWIGIMRDESVHKMFLVTLTTDMIRMPWMDIDLDLDDEQTCTSEGMTPPGTPPMTPRTPPMTPPTEPSTKTPTDVIAPPASSSSAPSTSEPRPLKRRSTA